MKTALKDKQYPSSAEIKLDEQVVEFWDACVKTYSNELSLEKIAWTIVEAVVLSKDTAQLIKLKPAEESQE